MRQLAFRGCVGLVALCAAPLSDAQTTTRCGEELGKWVCRDDPPARTPNSGGSTFESFARGLAAGQQNRTQEETAERPATAPPSTTGSTNSRPRDRPTIKFSAESVQELFVACRSTEKPDDTWTDHDAINFAVCINIVDGLTAGAATASSWADVLPPFCVPKQTTVGQRVKVFMNWADRNPQHWHKGPVFGVFSSMTEAFACSSAQ